MISTVFLLQTNSFNDVGIIFSTLWSLYSVSYVAIEDDELVFQKGKGKHWISGKNENNKLFITRCIMRCLDISGHIVIYAIFWINIGGLYAMCLLGIDMLFHISYSIIKRELFLFH